MSSSRSLNILTLFALLILQTVFGADPLYHFCSDTGNFSANDPYAKNLANLLPHLNVKTPFLGFSILSYGKEPDKSYGLAQCRGDVSKSDCKTCLYEAAPEITKRCPYNKGAIIWYDNCELKYSNEEFFGQINNQQKVYLYNVNAVSDPAYFNGKTKELLGKLAGEAVGTFKLYASGEMELTGSRTLYGLTQCTRDLSSEKCKTCLDEIISELPNCCDGKEGGRVIGGSCNFIYEIYPFVNS
jgi:hypothetical protein